jgi:glycosyltransferase involved in cell wall biosynthesis
MRILHVCADSGIPPDGTKGASVHFRSLHVALRQLGVRVVAFVKRMPKGPVPEVPDVRPIAELAASIVPGDVILERYALGQHAVLDIARAAGVPHLLEVNAPLVDEASRHRPDTVKPEDRDIEHAVWRGTDVVLAVSRPLLDRIAVHRSGPIDIVRNGFDPDLFEGPEPSKEIAPTLVFLGHPKPWHGAEALPKLLAHPALVAVGARLLVVGGGPGADALAEAARARGVDGRVTVTGPLPQREALRMLRTGHVAVAPYPVDEDFYFCPLKAIESLGAGMPVVSTKQGDLDEIVGDGGLLVPAGDDDAFADACARLLVDDALRRTAGEAGRRRAYAGMTWKHSAGQVVAAAEAALRRGS